MGKNNTSKRLIKVTDRHITLAVPEHSSKCMVAEGMKDSIPGATKLHVDMQTLRYTDDKGVRRTYLTPSSVQSALVRFDAGDPVEPFAFHLPQVIHINKPTQQTKAHDTTGRKAEMAKGSVARARIGGKAVPIMGNATRRRFGIRNLRINQEGQVVQVGTDALVSSPRA